jgi:hypothetical protein
LKAEREHLAHITTFTVVKKQKMSLKGRKVGVCHQLGETVELGKPVASQAKRRVKVTVAGTAFIFSNQYGAKG